jgi:hypothetical protein
MDDEIPFCRARSFRQPRGLETARSCDAIFSQRSGRKMTAYVFILIVGVCAGALSGIIGTGSTIILLPVLVYQFGPKQAVPIMAIAALMSNVGKMTA